MPTTEKAFVLPNNINNYIYVDRLPNIFNCLLLTNFSVTSPLMTPHIEPQKASFIEGKNGNYYKVFVLLK